MTPLPLWNFSENSSVLEGVGVPYSGFYASSQALQVNFMSLSFSVANNAVSQQWGIPCALRLHYALMTIDKVRCDERVEIQNDISQPIQLQQKCSPGII